MLKYLKYILFFSCFYILITGDYINLKILENKIIPLHIIIFVALLNYIEYFISALRYKELLYSQGLNIDKKKIYIWSLQGRFFDSFLPSSFGGDAVKIYTLNTYFKDKNIKNPLLYASILNIGDKAFAFSGLFFVSSISYLLILLGNYTLDFPHSAFFLSIAFLLSFSIILAIYISIYTDIRKYTLYKKILQIRYVGILVEEIMNIMENIGYRIKKLYKIILYSILNQYISLFSLFLLIYSSQEVFVYDKYIFLLLYFAVTSISYTTNLLGLFGGFGLGTLGIGYCLYTILGIQDAYTIVLLNQSINFITRFSCIFSILPLLKEKYK